MSSQDSSRLASTSSPVSASVSKLNTFAPPLAGKGKVGTLLAGGHSSTGSQASSPASFLQRISRFPPCRLQPAARHQRLFCWRIHFDCCPLSLAVLSLSLSLSLRCSYLARAQLEHTATSNFHRGHRLRKPSTQHRCLLLLACLLASTACPLTLATQLQLTFHKPS